MSDKLSNEDSSLLSASVGAMVQDSQRGACAAVFQPNSYVRVRLSEWMTRSRDN